MRTTLHNYIKAAAANFGCEYTAPEGGCQGTLHCDGLDLHIGLLENAGMVVFQTCVGTLPLLDREAFCTMLLKANDNPASTGDFTLGLDVAQEAVTLQTTRVLAFLDENSFSDMLGNLLNQSSEWMLRLDNWRPSAASSGNTQDDLLMMQNMLRV